MGLLEKCERLRDQLAKQNPTEHIDIQISCAYFDHTGRAETNIGVYIASLGWLLHNVSEAEFHDWLIWRELLFRHF